MLQILLIHICSYGSSSHHLDHILWVFCTLNVLKSSWTGWVQRFNAVRACMLCKLSWCDTLRMLLLLTQTIIFIYADILYKYLQGLTIVHDKIPLLWKCNHNKYIWGLFQSVLCLFKKYHGMTAQHHNFYNIRFYAVLWDPLK